MPIGLLLIIAGIVLMILNPFSGAFVIGAVITAVVAGFTLLAMILMATVWKRTNAEFRKGFGGF